MELQWQRNYMRLRGLYAFSSVTMASACLNTCRWYTVVGIATGYGMDGPGIENRRGRNFPHTSRPALKPTQPPVKWVTDLIPWGKVAGTWIWPSTRVSRQGERKSKTIFFFPPLGFRGLLYCEFYLYLFTCRSVGVIQI